MSRSSVAVLALAWLVAGCESTLLTPGPASPPASAVQASGTPTDASVTAPPPTPVGSTVDAPPCRPPDVGVEVTGEGGGGTILLVIRATNRGVVPCVLDGPPSSIALRAGGGSLPLTYQAHADPWPGDAPGAIAPPVLLQPNWMATARAIWSNWCLGPADVSTVWVGFGTEAMDASPNPTIAAPRCDNENAVSTVAGFPFQEDTSGG